MESIAYARNREQLIFQDYGREIIKISIFTKNTHISCTIEVLFELRALGAGR